ncbi:MAG: DUF1972 domain-containing protein [Methanobacterium sp.]|nr:MAG: DUF1972 domain-containing protein [Methanobacterium sp.]
MKIMIIGSRGIPAKYGGFETFAEGLSENLVKKGHQVTVSCEYEPPNSRKKDYNGVKLEYFPIKPPKNYLLRKFYENLSDIYFLIRLSRKTDLIYFLGIEVGMFLFIPKIINRKSKVMVNVDGVMWKRRKFNILERWLLKINHDFATLFADKIIVDSQAMKKYVNRKYWEKTDYISYGIDSPDRIIWDENHPAMKPYTNPVEINPGKYYLVVARLEPENNIHIIINGFIQSKLQLPLLIVGDFTSKEYQEEIESSISEASHNPHIIFLGSIYDQKFLNMLRQNCTAYIHGHTVGGTNPSLLEAAVSRNIIIAHDNQFNREVCGDSAVYFTNELDLTRKLQSISKFQDNYQDMKNEIYHHVLDNYSWNNITKNYLLVLQDLDKTSLKNKILMVISYPDNRLKKEMESLKKNGYSISLIIWKRSWPFPVDDDIEVKSLNLDVPVGNMKTLFYFPIWWTFLLFWILKMKWDIIHTVNFDTYLFSMIIAKIKRKPIIYDIFDFYGDMMNRFLRPIIANLDKYTMRFASAIIIADDSRIHQIGKNIKNKIITINNSPEDNVFIKNKKHTKHVHYNENKEDIKTKKDIGNAEDFKIFLGGKIIEERGIDQIISVVKDFKDVKLIIKGFCNQEKYKKKLLTRTKEMENIDMDLNGVPYDDIIQNSMVADLSLALYDPSIPNNKYASPNKLFESMASGTPIIVNENTPMADIVRKEKCGIIIPYKNKNALKKAISLIKNDMNLQKEMGNNGRNAYKNKYNWAIMEERLMNVYDQLLNLEIVESYTNKTESYANK